VKTPDAASLGVPPDVRRKVELARMEAAVAYFQARMELLGEPLTSNQTAQRKLFKHLYNKLSAQVAAERQTQTKVFSIEGLFDD
jgi:hypothetical protein